MDNILKQIRDFLEKEFGANATFVLDNSIEHGEKSDPKGFHIIKIVAFKKGSVVRYRPIFKNK